MSCVLSFDVLIGIRYAGVDFPPWVQVYKKIVQTFAFATKWTSKARPHIYIIYLPVWSRHTSTVKARAVKRKVKSVKTESGLLTCVVLQ